MNSSASKFKIISPPCFWYIIPKCRATKPQSMMPVCGEWMALIPCHANESLLIRTTLANEAEHCVVYIPHSLARSSWSRRQRGSWGLSRCSWFPARTSYRAVYPVPHWWQRWAKSNVTRKKRAKNEHQASRCCGTLFSPNYFSDFLVGYLVLVTVLVRWLEALHAQLSFKRTRLIVDAGMYDAAIVARLVESFCLFVSKERWNIWRNALWWG